LGPLRDDVEHHRTCKLLVKMDVNVIALLTKIYISTFAIICCCVIGTVSIL